MSPSLFQTYSPAFQNRSVRSSFPWPVWMVTLAPLCSWRMGKVKTSPEVFRRVQSVKVTRALLVFLMTTNSPLSRVPSAGGSYRIFVILMAAVSGRRRQHEQDRGDHDDHPPPETLPAPPLYSLTAAMRAAGLAECLGKGSLLRGRGASLSVRVDVGAEKYRAATYASIPKRFM